MRQFLPFLFLTLFFSGTLFAQVPQEFSFQAVATDDSGAELTAQPITVRASVMDGTASGIALWTERFDVTTDEFGLFAVNIGSGVPLGGTLSSFSDIPWGEDYFFLSIEIDPEGGNDFAFIGSKQLLSVPYALYSKGAEYSNAAGVADSAGIAATAADDMDRSPSNEIQDLNLTGTELSLTGSGVSVDIEPLLTDSDPNNEMQDLVLTNAELSLTNSNTTVDLTPLLMSVSDADGDSTNEIQDLVLNNTEVSLTNSSVSIDLAPLLGSMADADGDSTNELQDISLNNTELVLSGNSSAVDLSPLLTDADPSNEIQEIQLNNTELSLTGGSTNIDLAPLLTDSDPTNEIQELTMNGLNLGLTGSSNTIDLTAIPIEDADSNPANEIQTLFIRGDTLGISGGNELLLSNALNGAGGLNDPGATIDFPQGVTNANYLFVADTFTVPVGKTFYITAAEDELILPGVGSNFGRHLTGPNMPMFGEGTFIDNCRCIGFFKTMSADATPVQVILEPNQANAYTVPNDKNFVIKSGLDATTPITLNTRTVNFFSGSLKALVIPNNTTVRNIGNDEVILTGYMIKD